MHQQLQDRLALLAGDPRDPFRGTIRALAGAREAALYERPVREFILAIPALMRQIRAWASGGRFQPGIARLHGFAMAYLYSPVDLFPETTQGLFGYLDDAYIAARVYHRTLLEADWFAAGALPDGAPRPENVDNWVRLARRLLPEETAALDKMLGEVFVTRAGNYSALLAKAAAAGRAAKGPAARPAGRR
jgi:uncharacterized membrane protein YkvA (DUF1232 family)